MENHIFDIFFLNRIDTYLFNYQIHHFFIYFILIIKILYFFISLLSSFCMGHMARFTI